MKFTTTALTSLLFAATALCQSARIGFPTDGSSVTAGSNITVEVDRPDTLTGSTEVAIVLAVSPCSSGCRTPDQVLGNVLYNGPYNPQFQPGATSKPPHQNFTITIPSNLKGRVQLNFAHFTLIGAGPFPFLETSNITLNVQ